LLKHVKLVSEHNVILKPFCDLWIRLQFRQTTQTKRVLLAAALTKRVAKGHLAASETLIINQHFLRTLFCQLLQLLV
jgi:hypothetical protein